MHIAVEGLPFVGKTRLITTICKHNDAWTPQFDLRKDQNRASLDEAAKDTYLFDLRKMDAEIYSEQPNDQFLVEGSLITSLVYSLVNGASQEDLDTRRLRASFSPPPYMYVYLRADVDKCMRAARRKGLRVDRTYLEKLHEAYESAVLAGPQRFLIVDPGFKPLTVQRQIEERIKTWQKVNRK
jgi:thymidylate kinase